MKIENVEYKQFTRFSIFAIHAQLSIFINIRSKFIFIFLHIDPNTYFQDIPMEIEWRKVRNKNSIRAK